MLSARSTISIMALAALLLLAGCQAGGEEGPLPSPASDHSPRATAEIIPTEPATPTPFVPDSAATAAPAATATERVWKIGEEITIEYLRELDISGSEITFEQELQPTFNYERHLASYVSDGNRIYGLLTIPHEQPPEGGHPAIVFNHGYIPPSLYRTTERYVAYVDYLARSGFVVFKIDYRGHGQSEGEPNGSYFSPGYTIDSIAALRSLQTLDFVNPDGIGMWGHSMAGNLTLRAMLVEPEVQAGVIWAGAVYSYDDFAQYGIDDNTYRPPEPDDDEEDRPRRSRQIFDVYGRPDTDVPYWKAVSLTHNIDYLNSPLQLHHAQDDSVVSVAYSEGLAAVLLANDKEYEFHTYEGGGHNLFSPYFERAMLRTVAFFREHLTAEAG